MSRRSGQLGAVLLGTAKRAADAAVRSMVEVAAAEALAQLRVLLPPGIFSAQSSPPQKPQRVEYTARVIK